MRRVLVPVILVLAHAPAYASFTGQSVRAEVLFPNASTVSPGLFTPEVATVGPDVEFAQVESPGGNGLIAVDFSENNILLTNINGDRVVLPACGGCFFFRFSDENETIPDITGVTINGETNMPGFDASQISFDANSIRIDFSQEAVGDAIWRTSEIVSIDVMFAPEPQVYDFPTIVAGAGNRTDVYATAFCDPADPPRTIEATFLSQSGEVVETKEDEVICNGTIVLPFTGGNDLVFGHNRVQIDPPVQDGILIEVMALDLEGAAPLGVNVSAPCSGASFTVLRNEALNAATAVSNPGASPLNCSIETWAADGTSLGQTAFEVAASGQNQFFVSETAALPEVFTGRGDVTCNGPFFLISFFQTSLGGLTTNPVNCRTDPE